MAEPSHPRFVTIDYFIKDMLGYKSRISYYNHIKDPRWPQRVYPTGDKPMLDFDECVAFMEWKKGNREKPATPFKKSRPEPLPGGKKRHPGRPAKVTSAA